MCGSPKVEKPKPLPSPPDPAEVQKRREASQQTAAKKGLLSTQQTGPQGLLSQAPVAQRSLTGA